jgi:acyl carrier protein
MNSSDPLRRLLVDFFDLPSDTCPENISQQAIASWDSLAMVQLIADLQGTFMVEFDLSEIERLRSYDEIRSALHSKGAFAAKPADEDAAPRFAAKQESE